VREGDKNFYFLGFLPFTPLRFLFQMAKWRSSFAKATEDRNATGLDTDFLVLIWDIAGII
jgi:hypothetical protein